MKAPIQHSATVGLFLLFGLFLTAALPGDSTDVIFCPNPQEVLLEESWSTGAEALISDRDLAASLLFETSGIGSLGDRHLVCTYRMDHERTHARFHFRMQMPENYSCTPSGPSAFVCRIRW